MVAEAAISPQDRALMAALDNPAAPIDPFEFAQWAQRPEIQRALAARQTIREIREQDRLAAARHLAIDTLKAVIAANKDLTSDTQRLESRRAASAILRMTGQPAATPRPGLPASLGLVRLRPRVRPAPDLPPDRVAALAVAALAHPTDESLADLAPFLIPNADDEPPDVAGIAIDHDLDRSPATAARYAVTGSSPDRLNYTVTLARRERPPTRLALSLFKRDRAPRRDCWLIYGIVADTAPAPETG